MTLRPKRRYVLGKLPCAPLEEITLTPGDGLVCLSAYVDGKRAEVMLDPRQCRELALRFIHAAEAARQRHLPLTEADSAKTGQPCNGGK